MKRVFRLNRSHIALAHDVVVAGLSFAATMWLRLGEAFIGVPQDYLVQGCLLLGLVAGPVFWMMRLYRGVWRYASLNDLWNIVRASSLAILLFFPLLFLLSRLDPVPRSAPVINWFVLMALLGGPRFLYRIAKDRRLDLKLEREGRRRIPVLLVGAGDAAELFLRAMSRADSEYQVVGMVSVRIGRVGRGIHGIDVLGTLDDLPRVVQALDDKGLRPQRLVLTTDDLDGAEVRAVLDTADGLGLTLARLPKLTDFKTGLADKLEVKPIAVEDLLGRPQAVLDRAAMRVMIAGRRIMVTGAGGTIGSELVRQISDFLPAHLTLFDNGEYNLYLIDQELENRHPIASRRAVIGDVRDQARVREVFARERPELVFHAAALKHVPLVEANPDEGVLTNVIGTRHVADACREFGVRSMVLISTDKAINPTSVMGACKRLAECWCQSLDLLGSNADAAGEEGAARTHYVTVRFGNVLGSTGSVVPLFQRQLAAGGPLTVTHPDITRYFMTVREAVELVLQASALAAPPKGAPVLGGRGKIFVLDMGEPVKILDLARQMIRLAGLRPDLDIKIQVTGLRPGEKLFEELFHDKEHTAPTACDGILLASPRVVDREVLAQALAQLEQAARMRDVARCVALIRELVPEYQPGSNPPPPASVLATPS